MYSPPDDVAVAGEEADDRVLDVDVGDAAVVCLDVAQVTHVAPLDGVGLGTVVRLGQTVMMVFMSASHPLVLAVCGQ